MGQENAGLFRSRTMKQFRRISILMLIAVLAGVLVWPPIKKAAAYYTSIVASEQATLYGPWRSVATLASAGTEPTDLAGGERTYATIAAAIAADVSGDGKIVLAELPFGCNAPRFFVSGITDNAVIVLRIYSGSKGGASNCVFKPRGTLTFTIGTQAGITATYELADTCALTSGSDAASITNWSIASPANNTCTEVVIDTQGDDWVCIVATTIGCDAIVWIKDY